jgi:hypothetical protein
VLTVHQVPVCLGSLLRNTHSALHSLNVLIAYVTSVPATCKLNKHANGGTFSNGLQIPSIPNVPYLKFGQSELKKFMLCKPRDSGTASCLLVSASQL